jgi:inorganic triphosphatase YgiF
METELKLALPAGARRKIERHAVLRGAAASTRREVTTYFDTPTMALAAAGLSLRIRRAGRVLTQTVKAEADESGPSGGAALQRGEWEWRLRRAEPDLALLKGTPAAARLPEGAAEQLHPVFATEINRTSRELRLDARTEAEIVIDQGAIRAGEKSEPVRELEIELKGGSAEPLYRLALELHGLAPVGLLAESKAGRGYRLVAGKTAAPQKPGKIDLAADVGFHDGLRQIVGACVGHLLTNIAATLAGDAEGLHQMRVALRRLRSALVLFKPQLEPYAAARFTEECRHFGHVFGEARDLDVFVLETLADAEREGVDVSRLKPPAEERRTSAHQKVVALIADPVFTGFVLALSAWIEGDAWAAAGEDGADILKRPLADLAPKLLDRMARKAQARGGSHLSREKAEKLHELRKSLKRLRYSTEYLGGLYGRKGVKGYRQACEDLQNALGAINDMHSTVDFGATLAGSTADLVPDVGALAQWCEAGSEACRSEIDKAWKAFKDTPRFWR